MTHEENPKGDRIEVDTSGTHLGNHNWWPPFGRADAMLKVRLAGYAWTGGDPAAVPPRL